MSRQRIAHRADFSVRCACGNVFNTDDSHIGKQLRCRCGRVLTIARPPDEYVPPAESPEQARASRAAKERAEKDAQRAARARERAGQPRFEWLRRVARPVRTALGTSVIAMASARPLRRWGARFAWLYTIAMFVSWWLLVATSEKFLPSTLLAYGPRMLLLAPLLVLVPWALVAVRSALLPLALAALVGIGPVMGGRVSVRSLGRPLPASPAPGAFRVISFNTFGGDIVAQRLDEVVELNPDLIAFQECGEGLLGALRKVPGMHVAVYHAMCTASRWPITNVDSMPRGDLNRIANYGFGGTGLVVRYLLQGPHGPMVFVNVHLETARKGLQAFSSDQGFIPDDVSGLAEGSQNAARRSAAGLPADGPDMRVSAGEALEINTRIRDRESERAAMWSLRGDKTIPVIVAGDFNLPVESTIFARHWGHFRDAFEEAGTGFGWSKREGRLLRVRIDHVLANEAGPRPIGAWLGPDLGSDHLPVVADLRWR